MNRQKAKKKRRGVIYAIELDAFIKVGFTTNLPERMNTYRTSNLTVNLLCQCKATLAQEKHFHGLFNKGREKYDKWHKEWIMEAIALIGKLGYHPG